MTKADWLRSEIEKLEGMKKEIPEGYDQEHFKIRSEGHNQALTSIITRYKEELKVLESK